MKNLRYIFILLLVCNYSNSYTQNFGSCGFNEITDEEFNAKAPNCSNTSTTWTNQYRNPGYWVANNNTPVKTILVNWVICQKNDGTNAWQETLF